MWSSQMAWLHHHRESSAGVRSSPHRQRKSGCPLTARSPYAQTQQFASVGSAARNTPQWLCWSVHRDFQILSSCHDGCYTVCRGRANRARAKNTSQVEVWARLPDTQHQKNCVGVEDSLQVRLQSFPGSQIISSSGDLTKLWYVLRHTTLAGWAL